MRLSIHNQLLDLSPKGLALSLVELLEEDDVTDCECVLNIVAEMLDN